MHFFKASLCLLLAGCGSVFAQTEAPSAAQMIEQLKPPVRTRSFRNLTVEAVAPNQAETADQANTSGAAVAPTQPQPQTTGQAAQPAPSLSLSVQFDFDSARIRSESFAALGNLAAALQSSALAQSKFAIEGHTDAKGAVAYNLRLSAQRAQSVKDFLTTKGVDARQLAASGKGSSDPANKSDPLAAENRRVRIVNLD